MNDFDTDLTAILDDAAAAIEPHPDFDAVGTSRMRFDSRTGAGRRRFPRSIGIAAVSLALLGGGVAAFEAADGEPEQLVSPAAQPQDSSPREPAPSVPVSVPDVGELLPLPVVPVGDRSDEKPTEPSEPLVPVFARTARLGDGELDRDPMLQPVSGRAAPGEAIEAVTEFGSASAVADSEGGWELVLELHDVPAGESVQIRVTFGRSSVVYEFVIERPATPADEPEPTPTTEPDSAEEPDPEKPKPEQPKPEEPAPIAFTAELGSTFNDDLYMKQGFHGSAPAGSKITIGSEWGSAHTTAGPKGGWEARLELRDVPDDTVVVVRVSTNTSDRVFDFELVRDRPAPEPEPEAVPFTANLGGADLGSSPMKQGFYGTGTPGSFVLASSEFGSADAVVDSKGKWELHLKMFEVPAGTTVGVLVTNSASDAVHDFGLRRPEPEPEPEPDPVDFTANAALTESDSTPLVNEYWGTSTPGAVIAISSEYGGGEVTANGDGRWEARIEFSTPPAGDEFKVTITSSLGDAVYHFWFTRLGSD